jgi:predicted transcriptional regulator
MSGAKTAEVRRRFPALPPNTTVYVYASSPVRAIIGTLRLDAVHVGATTALWQQFGERLDISKAYFDAYLDGRDSAAVVELRPHEGWGRTVSLDELRQHVGLEPPQSFRYLSLAHEALLREDRASDS